MERLRLVFYILATVSILIGSSLSFNTKDISSWAFLIGSVLFVINSLLHMTSQSQSQSQSQSKSQIIYAEGVMGDTLSPNQSQSRVDNRNDDYLLII